MTGLGGDSVVAGDAVLQAVVDAAVQATAAIAGWLVTPRDDELLVVASVGEGAHALVGRTVPVTAGTAGFVIASAQPLALGGSGDDRLAHGVPELLGHLPNAVLCVPCVQDDAVIGALELIDKEGTSRFTFDDVEIVTLLAGIAAAALAAAAPATVLPSPSELAADLQRLAAADVRRYAAVAGALTALLGDA